MVRASCGCPSARLCLRCLLPPCLLQTPPQPCAAPPSVPPQTPPFRTPFQGRLWPCSPWMLPVPVLGGLPPPSAPCWPSSQGTPPAPLPSRRSSGSPCVSCRLSCIWKPLWLPQPVGPVLSPPLPPPRQADRIPDSRAHTCPPQTEQLTLFRRDLPSRGSEAKQQEWPRALGARGPCSPPRPVADSGLQAYSQRSSVSRTDCESPVLH